MNKKVLIGTCVIILTIIAIVNGCPGPTTANTLDARFGNFPQPSKAISSVEIYFDASTSMKGYFASGDGQISNIVSRFEKIGNNSKIFLVRKNDNVDTYSGYSTDLQNNLN